MTPKESLNAAKRAVEIGDFAQASALYAQVLTKLPKHDAAKRGLAKAQKSMGGRASLTQGEVDQVVQLLHAGEFQRVIEDVRVLIAKAPTEALLHNIAGMAHQALDQTKEAIPSFRKAVKINPNYSEARSNLGAALIKMNEFEAAIVELERTVKDNPNMTAAWNSLANGYLSSDRLADAENAAHNALTLDPNYTNALITQGLVLSDMGKHKASVEPLLKILKTEPNNTDVLQNLGNAYSATRELDKAVDAHEKVLQINPDSVDAKSALAGIYGWQGDIDRAKRVFYEIIAEYPSAPEPYRGLSLIHKFSEDDELIPTLENIYNSSSDEQVTMHIGFTLAKAYHDTKSYSSAFGPLLKANAIRAKAEIYDPAKREEILADTKNRYIAARGHVAGSMNSEPQLIFIVGMNRSGTSLIEQIVASHSSVFGGGERSEFVLAAEDTLQLEGPLDQSTVDTLHAEFTETMRGISGSCRYASDKLPMNFQWIGLIKTVFPTAKIINTVRDPRDVCLSNFRNYFSSKGNAYCYTLEHLAHYFGEYRNMMKFWHAEFPGEIFDCCYEDLTENQESVSRNLIKYLELEWEDQVLDFHKTKRDVITASVAQVRQKMYKGSVSGWRAYEEMLQPLIDGLNENGSLPYRRLDWLKDS